MLKRMTSGFATLTLRHASLADLSAVDALLARSYPRLLAPDYPPSVLVTAVPIIARARPELLASGRYWLAEDAAGHLMGAGGWSGHAPTPSDGSGGAGGVRYGMAHVRHVATDPDAVRRGVGRALMARVMAEARATGFAQMECLSTRTAVPFYAALGFREIGPIDVGLRPGISFPAIRMICTLA
jgi:GNAT superfamily N-acetyltransferase